MVISKHKVNPRIRKTNTCSSYKKFLRSAYWKKVKTMVLIRDGYRCRFCGSRSRLCVHHLTYVHHGFEHIFLCDLIVLCNLCHIKVHRINPTPK